VVVHPGPTAPLPTRGSCGSSGSRSDDADMTPATARPSLLRAGQPSGHALGPGCPSAAEAGLTCALAVRRLMLYGPAVPRHSPCPRWRRRASQLDGAGSCTAPPDAVFAVAGGPGLALPGYPAMEQVRSPARSAVWASRRSTPGCTRSDDWGFPPAAGRVGDAPPTSEVRWHSRGRAGQSPSAPAWWFLSPTTGCPCRAPHLQGRVVRRRWRCCRWCCPSGDSQPAARQRAAFWSRDGPVDLRALFVAARLVRAVASVGAQPGVARGYRRGP